MWRQFKHPNVLKFFGIDRESFNKTNLLRMVSLWMPHGTLRSFYLSNVYSAAQHCVNLVRGAPILSRAVHIMADGYSSSKV
jgi:hypothetical protein